MIYLSHAFFSVWAESSGEQTGTDVSHSNEPAGSVILFVRSVAYINVFYTFIILFCLHIYIITFFSDFPILDQKPGPASRNVQG